MKIKRSTCLTRSLAAFAICCCVSQLMIVAAAPQNYLEQAAAGAMDMAMKMGEILQNGGAVRKEFGFQLPGITMHSKTAVGMGEAMIRRSDSSEEDSDERRKRSLTSDELPDGAAGKGPHTTFTKLMRNINAPCIGGGTGGGGTGGAGDGGDGEDIVDEARRRIARMKARKAAGGKKSTTSKSKKRSGRRRRQVEAADLEGLGESEQAQLEAEFRAHMQQFAEKMNHAYEHIAASVMEMMKRMEENFYAEGDK